MSGTASNRRPPGVVLALSRGIRRPLIFAVRGYQITLSPFLGNHCRYLPTCSDYALIALRSKPAWKALGLIVWRLMRCQPLCKSGWDPVEESPTDEWYRIRVKTASRENHGERRNGG